MERSLLNVAQSGDFFQRDAIHMCPEVRRARRKAPFGADHVLDLFFREILSEPGDLRCVAQFQNPENGVLRVLQRIEGLKVDIPEYCSELFRYLAHILFSLPCPTSR